MEGLAARYARWKAPAQDGQVVLWPDASELLSQTQSNHRHLAHADSAWLQGVPLPEVRRKLRQWIGHDDDQLLVATGHQTELHHPGVWVKNGVITAIAQKLGGRAYHFAVDTDEPKHLVVRWPGGSALLTDDPSAASAHWSGLVPPPSPAHLAAIDKQFNEATARWNFTPLVPEFLRSMRRRALAATNLPGALAESLHELDWSLGLRYDAMVVSPITLSEPYLLFAHHVLSRADEFAADYNASLEQFRRDNKIRSPGRPMPNLRIGDDSCEVPFWLDSLATATRQRASVARSNGQWVLRTDDGNEFRVDPLAEGWDAAARLMFWLRRSGLRLSPRALTLTSVLRLLVADQFVHGIGGGQYDQVLDLLIARHFGIDPPRFSVTTATLYFPEAVGRERVCLPCLVQEGHQLKHRMLGNEKSRLVAEIAALPRHSIDRLQLFRHMHGELARAWNMPTYRTWEQQFQQATQRAKEERVLFDRELFYAIQSKDRLEMLLHEVRRQLA
jgi:hypothetical protein